jgi:hypothetical protein
MEVAVMRYIFVALMAAGLLWKLLLDGAHEFLFNLREDVTERTELGAQYPDRVRQLRALIESWEKNVNSEAKPQQPTPPSAGR